MAYLSISFQLVTLLALAAFLYLIVKQQGRILLRLDQLEDAVSRIAVSSAEAAEDGALKTGDPMPGFAGTAIGGEKRTEASFKGRGLLLIHWSTGCGFCTSIERDLDLLLGPLKKNNLELLLISVGDAKEHREHIRSAGLLDCLLMVKTPDALPIFFQNTGTPVAFLIGEDGLVSKAMASGAPEVIHLARDAARDRPPAQKLPGQKPLSESRIERNGLPAGALAPDFRLNDLTGRSVSLKDYQGRRLVLIFSDPHCGPCEELARRLGEIGDLPPGHSILMVGRGDAEQNRVKAEALGIRHPMVVQKQWELSKRFGIFATPVAFLIDEHGVIERGVASGVDEIRGLIASIQQQSLVGGRNRAES